MSTILIADYSEKNMAVASVVTAIPRTALCILLMIMALSFVMANPLSVYLQEGFNGQGLPQGWTVVPDSGSTAFWSIIGTGTHPPISPYEGTGQAKFNSFNAAVGHQARLISYRLTLSGSTDPLLSFFMYHDTDSLSSWDSLYVEVTTGDSISGPWTTLSGSRRPQGSPGWEQEFVSLRQYNAANALYLAFRGVSKHGTNMYIDQVRIADSHDIRTAALLLLAGPFDTHTRPSYLSPLDLGAVVQNVGIFSEASYHVRWQIDGQNQPAVNNVRTLEESERDTLILSWATPTLGAHVITAWTVLSTDSNRSNDTLRRTIMIPYLQEGFNALTIPAGWTVTTVSGVIATWGAVGTGTNPPIAPHAGPGQAKFNSYDAAPGEQARLSSLRFTLSSAVDPFLSFFMYHDDEFLTSLDSMYVEATTGDSVAGPWTLLGGYQRPRATPGWKQEVVSLLPYNGAGRVFVSFRGVSQYGNNMYIDEVRIPDSSFHDIGTVGLSSPANLSEAGSFPSVSSRVHWIRSKSKLHMRAVQSLMAVPLATPLTMKTVVQNYGTFPEPSYQVNWQIDGQNQAPVSNPRTLPRNGRDSLTLSWLTPTPGTHRITAWTSLSADSNESNDSVRLTVVVLDSNIAFAEMFNGAGFPPDGWTVVNRDWGTLPPWFRGNATSIFLPYEGTGFAADNFERANGTYLDDYLISPPIPGIAEGVRSDTLGFWVRSALNPPPQTNYPDSLMVLLSTTGADTSNFTTVLDYFSVPKTGWTLERYPLSGRVPNGSTIRVAFRYLLFDGGSSGNSSDFVGVDFVHLARGVQTGVSPQRFVPSVFSMEQNYPNPFNPTTEIAFSVKEAGVAALDLYNILGERISSLFDGEAQPGITYHVRLDGSRLASGVYYYVLQARSGGDGIVFRNVRRMILLK